MSYQPAENLTNRTFVGLIIAQFLAGFNDQAIHAAAMFYAIHTKILSQATAITLMPILFYAPWAIFCTLAGYYADRYSKTMTLRIWKVAEIGISLLLMAGFYFGSDAEMPMLGGWLVMTCVFTMGTHAAFFAPAKYGAMPEILRAHILSRGNGILESTTFLASILGTVAGGLLFNTFRDDPIWIGVVLLVLSVIGAAASFMIVWLPSASPERKFPINLFKPLFENLKVMFRSRPLALAVLGIAFFVFMVSYMRASVYMHGETRNPRWDEEKTSLIVATVALGVGLGSPLAGYLSGGKVELGLVPLGCFGMIVALFIAAIAIEATFVLVIALIIIGFFSGFYMVPLYTLLQQRAPKKSKGELVATSNFINVTGAIAASVLFNVLVQISRLTGMTPEIPTEDPALIKGLQAEGKLREVHLNKHGKIVEVEMQLKGGEILDFKAKSQVANGVMPGKVAEVDPVDVRIIDFDDNFFDFTSGPPQKEDEVIVSKYVLRDVKHYLIRRADVPMRKIYDNEILPRYLFIGAGLMTIGILIMLRRKLPDFYVRSLFWFKSLGRFQLKAVGMQHLPTEGPVILVTNCKDMLDCLKLVSATDRSTKVIMADDDAPIHDGPLLSWLAQRYVLVLVRPDKTSWLQADLEAQDTLRHGHLLAISVASEKQGEAIEELLRDLHDRHHVPVLPVYCGTLDEPAAGVKPRVRVVFGEMMHDARGTPGATATAGPLASGNHTGANPPPAITPDDCKKAIAELGAWIRAHDAEAGIGDH